MLNGIEGFESKELDEKTEYKRYWENGVVIVSEYDETLKNERNNIIRIANKQGWILNKFKELNKFVEMVKQQEISKLIHN